MVWAAAALTAAVAWSRTDGALGSGAASGGVGIVAAATTAPLAGPAGGAAETAGPRAALGLAPGLGLTAGAEACAGARDARICKVAEEEERVSAIATGGGEVVVWEAFAFVGGVLGFPSCDVERSGVWVCVEAWVWIGAWSGGSSGGGCGGETSVTGELRTGVGGLGGGATGFGARDDLALAMNMALELGAERTPARS